MTPRFSILTPVHDPPIPIWRACIESVQQLLSDDWQWCVVDDGSTDPQVRQTLTDLMGDDRRVVLVHQEQAGIVAATNRALAEAEGEYLLMLDHDDELHPDALGAVAGLLTGEVDLLYSDEDVVDGEGEVVDPVRKPGWSPSRLRAHNYVNHLCVLRAETVRRLGGWREGFDGSQDHDLVLRVSEQATAVYHVPQVLYRWRMAPRSVLTQGLAGKPGALEAGRRAVQEHCDRLGLDADVVLHDIPGIASWYRLAYRFTRPVSVGVVVPVLPADTAPQGPGGEAPLLAGVRSWVDGLAGFPAAVCLAVAPGCDEAVVEAALTLAGTRSTARVVRSSSPSPALLRQLGAAALDVEVLVFVDGGALITTDTWLPEVVGPVLEGDVGAVGARLLRPSGVVESCGYAFVDDAPALMMAGLPATTTAYAGAALVVGERSAVPATLLAVRQEVFRGVGGFSQRYTGALEDVDLSLKLRADGRRVLCTPLVDVTVPSREPAVPAPGDVAELSSRWRHWLAGDPYLHPDVSGHPWTTPLPNLPPAPGPPDGAGGAAERGLQPLDDHDPPAEEHRASMSTPESQTSADESQGGTEAPRAPATAVPGEVRPQVAAPSAPAPATGVAPLPLGVKQRVVQVARTRLPAASRRRAVAKATYQSYLDLRHVARQVRGNYLVPGLLQPAAPSYQAWCRMHDATADELRAQAVGAAQTPQRTTMLVCVDVGAGDGPAAVRSTLTSIQAQSWGWWEAVVHGPGAIPAATMSDQRVRVHQGDLRAATAGSSADFVVFLRAGDRLAPDCLWQVLTLARQDPKIDVITWDDDLVDASGHRRDPRMRPSWSPDALLGSNYVGRSFAVRRSALDGVADPTATQPGVWEWELLLSLDLDESRVARISRVLSHLTSRDEGVGPDGARMVARRLAEQGRPAQVTADAASLRVRWQLEQLPTVSIVIPTRHNRRNLSRCLPSLARTDYPAFDVRVIDNGGRTDEREQWYREHTEGLDLSVTWWEESPFNYSRVNNVAARQTNGDVVVFLNDDTEVLDPRWLQEMVSWAVQPGMGCVGLQLTTADGSVQSAGTIMGLGGFADHVFEGMSPSDDSLLGPVSRYRNVLAVTGACLAVTREVFERIGGMDERFILCGSDVAMGLDCRLEGLRNVCSPFSGVRHLESATRGSSVPIEDFFASYWKYSTWLFGGDPYFSPNLSLGSRTPVLRSPQEPTPQERVSPVLGRSLTVFRQRNDEGEARMLADQCRLGPADVEAVHALHEANAEPFAVRTVNWYIPDIDSPFYGGINTALRMADFLARVHGVENRFVVWGSPPDYFVRSALAAAFPSLAGSPIHFYDGSLEGGGLQEVPESDVSVATLWVTAYAVAKAPRTRRKVYLVQDFEPMFYPASTLYALTEETYKLGLYALCNTENMAKISREDYGAKATAFSPAVLPSVFHARGRAVRTPDEPRTVFVYARPGHWRNCWELASLALEELKDRLGDRVRIVTAGAWASGAARPGTLRSLGLLDYRATGDLYRTCDVGLALTVSKHPSYLPLELMACGVPVVAFDNPWGHWILRHGENSLLAQRTVPGLVEALETMVTDDELRERLSKAALADIAAHHGDWDQAFGGIYDYLSDPEGGRDS